MCCRRVQNVLYTELMKKNKRNEPGVPGKIDFTNFHQSTRAEFCPSPPPDREPDFISPAGSVYWDIDGEGVLRSSDHWAGLNGCTGQASCVWSILDAVRPGVWVSGYCAYEDFRHRVWLPRRHVVDERATEIAHGIQAGGGAFNERSHIPKPVPVWAKVNFRGSQHADSAAQSVFERDQSVFRLITADEAIVRSILSGQTEVEHGRYLY